MIQETEDIPKKLRVSSELTLETPSEKRFWWFYPSK